jgi:hypothetical protein
MKMQKNLADASKAQIVSMENRLAGILKPIAPRREFVHGLGQRMQVGNRASLVNQVANWHILAAMIACLISLAVLLAMVARALLTLSAKKRTA